MITKAWDVEFIVYMRQDHGTIIVHEWRMSFWLVHRSGTLYALSKVLIVLLAAFVQMCLYFANHTLCVVVITHITRFVIMYVDLYNLALFYFSARLLFVNGIKMARMIW